jgi:hypothetical protein
LQVLWLIRFDGAWLSPVERSVRDREVVGSNPIAPTIKMKGLGRVQALPLSFTHSLLTHS